MPHDSSGLVLGVLELVEEGGRPFAGSAEFFRMAFAVERDQAVRPFENLLGRTVVHLEPDDLGVRPVFSEVQDVRHLGAPPSVDRLVVVPHHTEIPMGERQRLDDPVLTLVRVLIFVDQNVVEELRFRLERIGKMLEEIFGQQENVVEIDRAQGFQQGLITPVGDRHDIVVRVRSEMFERLFGADSRRLPLTDPADQVGGADRGVRLDVAQNLTRRRFLIAGAVYRKDVRESEQIDPPAENPHAIGMERRNDRFRPVAVPQSFADPLFHLPRRLVREGYGEDPLRFRPLIDKVRYAECHHTGLSRPRPGQNQKGTRKGVDHLLLLRVELIFSFHRPVRVLL